jgi:hypothetical protein
MKIRAISTSIPLGRLPQLAFRFCHLAGPFRNRLRQMMVDMTVHAVKDDLDFRDQSSVVGW